MAVLTTAAAVDYLTGKEPEPGKRRAYSRRRLIKAARAGEVPVWQWTERGPLFSTADLDRFQDSSNRSAA